MYVLVGGNPFTGGHTGTTTFTGLSVVGTTDSFAEMEVLAKKFFDECAGLLIVLYNGVELEFDDKGMYMEPNTKRNPNCPNCQGTGTQNYLYRGLRSGCECLCYHPFDLLIKKHQLDQETPLAIVLRNVMMEAWNAALEEVKNGNDCCDNLARSLEYKGKNDGKTI